MQNKIENLINEAIGEDKEENWRTLSENMQAVEAISIANSNSVYNQALADLRSKTPELAKKIMELIKQSNLALLEEVEKEINSLFKGQRIKINTKQEKDSWSDEVITIPLDQEETRKLTREATIIEILSTLSKHKDRLSEK